MFRLKKLLGNDQLMKWWIKQLDCRPEFGLIHGVYTPLTDILPSFQARCRLEKMDYGKFTWDGPKKPPAYDPEDSEIVVVLDVALDTLQNTFEFALRWIADDVGLSCNNDLATDSDHLALLEGCELKPWSLRWVRIKLDAGKSHKEPRLACSPVSSPACSLLFMIAEHPEKQEKKDHSSPRAFWIPGLRCKRKNSKIKSLDFTPYFTFRSSRNRGINLCLESSNRHIFWALPQYV
ncbi:MAG: hypothetical protein ABIB04_02375 [Patescibacteria group bacterium]